MTCRFEEEFAGRQYPRSCPECVLGPCKRDYEQVRLTPEQGERLGFHYVIVDPKGKPEPGKQAKWNSAGSGIPSQVLIAMGNKRTKVSQETLDGVAEAEGLIGHSAPEPIPAGVYFNIDNFYDTKTRRGMGHDFWLKWCARKNEFPTDPEPKPTPAEIGDIVWGRAGEHDTLAEAPKPHPFMAPSKFDPDIHRADVSTKLSRVQRAKIMDLIEDALKDRPVLIDIAVDEYTKRLIAILDET